MIKKVSLVILLILVSGTLLAVSFTLDPASIISSWYNAKHWPGVTAAALFSGMFTVSWKIGAIENETQAKMIADLFKTARVVAVFLLVIEFYQLLKGFLINALGIAVDIVSNFFSFMSGIL